MATDSRENIVRHLLTAIDDDAGVSQRKLSSEMGIAVGSVNWHLKRCVNKGFIKLQQAPVKRYLYYLTPKGFEEKARLTAAFVQSSFSLYRRGREECAEIFKTLQGSGSREVVFAGDGDFAEIAVVSAIETGTEALAVVDGGSSRGTCAGIPVVATLEAAMEQADNRVPAAILLTDLDRPKAAYLSVVSQLDAMGVSPEIVHVPRILNFRPSDGTD